MLFYATEKSRPENDARAQQMLATLRSFDQRPYPRQDGDPDLSVLIAEIPQTGWLTNNEFSEYRIGKNTLIRIDSDGVTHALNPLDHPEGAFNYARLEKDLPTSKSKKRSKEVVTNIHCDPGKFSYVTVLDKKNTETRYTLIPKKVEDRPKVEEKKIRKEDSEVRQIFRIWVSDLFKNTTSNPEAANYLTLAYILGSVPKEGWTDNENDDKEIRNDYSNTDSEGNIHRVVVKKDGTLKYDVHRTKKYLEEHSKPGDIVVSNIETSMKKCDVEILHSGEPKSVSFELG